MIAHYVHNIDPVIFSINEAIKLRWYGISYLLAFVVGFLLLRMMGRKKLWVLPGSQAGDFIALAALCGVFVGGRLGNVLIYQRAEFFADPIMVFKVWQGGMASHGGILGVTLFALVYAQIRKTSWSAIGDGICVVAPLGIMFGRLANFINGELYGRVVHGVDWAMKFPLAINQDLAYSGKQIDAADRALLAPQHSPEAIAELCRNNEAAREVVATYLEPRYPSQLFQAAGEGLCLFLILFTIRMLFKKLPNGLLTGIFFIGYAFFRIAMENYREPETTNVTMDAIAHLQIFAELAVIFILLAKILPTLLHKYTLYRNAVLGALSATIVGLAIKFVPSHLINSSWDYNLTMGQYLSMFMIVIGLAFLAFALIARNPLVQAKEM